MDTATAATEPRDLELVESRIEPEVNELLDAVTALVIASPRDADNAAELRNDIVERRKRIETWFSEPVAAAHAAHRALTQRRADAIARYAPAEKAINAKLTAYHAEQERQRREAELAAERERARLIEEERLRRAEKAEAAGDGELAELIIEGRMPEPVPHVPVAAPVPHKPAGVAFVARPKGEVVDLGAVIQAAASGNGNARAILCVDTVALNRLVTALGEALSIPGVRVAQVNSIRTSGRR